MTDAAPPPKRRHDVLSVPLDALLLQALDVRSALTAIAWQATEAPPDERRPDARSVGIDPQAIITKVDLHRAEAHASLTEADMATTSAAIERDHAAELAKDVLHWVRRARVQLQLIERTGPPEAAVAARRVRTAMRGYERPSFTRAVATLHEVDQRLTSDGALLGPIAARPDLRAEAAAWLRRLEAQDAALEAALAARAQASSRRTRAWHALREALREAYLQWRVATGALPGLVPLPRDVVREASGEPPLTAEQVRAAEEAWVRGEQLKRKRRAALP